MSGQRLVEILDTVSVAPVPSVPSNGTPRAPPKARTPTGAPLSGPGQSAFAGEAAPARVGSVSFVRSAAAHGMQCQPR